VRRLAIRPGAIGDCILALAALEHLRADYLEIWVPGPSAPLVRFRAQVRSIAATGLDLVGIPDREPPAGLLEYLAGFDEIVSWYGTANPDFRAAVAGLPFRFLAAQPDERAGIHAADFLLAQAGGAGPAVPRIDCPRTPGEFAVIHPFSGSARKNWPLERYRELAGQLVARVPVAWCTGSEDELAGAVRFDDLYELGCWLAGARLYVGNDSGITHLAAAVGTPVVALFGPSDPAIWAPRGPRVRVVATARPGEPIERIALSEVLEAATAVLGSGCCASAPDRA
jgi:heptosyltransferase-3